MQDRTIVLVTRGGQAKQASDGFERVFTANPRAARAHGLPHLSLDAEAGVLARRLGLAACPPLKARRLLRQACAELGIADPAGSSVRYQPAVREAIRTGTGPEALAAAGPRGARLARLLERYRELLTEAALYDPADQYWLAVAAGPEPARVAVVGYTHLGSGEAAFINALAGPGSELRLPVRDVLGTGGADTYAATHELTASFKSSGWTVKSDPGPDPSTGPVMTAETFQNTNDEVRAVLSHAKQLMAGGARPGDIVLITRDEAGYGPVVQAIAWEFGLRVSSYNPVPLEHTRIGELAGLVTEVVTGGFPFEATTRLARHAFGPDLPRAAWRDARRSGASGATAWRGHGLATELLTWPERAAPAEYTRHLTGCLDAWDAAGRAAHGAHDAYALQALREGIRELELLYPDGQAISLPQWCEDLEDFLALSSVPAAPGRGGLELHTPLSVTGASYRHAFVLGAIEGSLPPRPPTDPVLPWHLRQQVDGLERITQLVKREAATLRSAIAAATESVCFTLPLDFHRGAAALPSPLLAELGVSTEPGRRESLASIEEQRRQAIRLPGPTDDAVLEAARRALKVEAGREGPGGYDEYDGIAGIGPDLEKRTMSVSQLSTLGSCPFRWFAGYLLGLEPDDDALSEADSLTIGNLYHETLDLAITRLQARGVADVAGSLVAEIPAAFAITEAGLGRDKVDLRRLPGWALIRNEHLDALTRAASSPEFFAGEPVASEVRFEEDWRGLRMRGMIDRIDRADEGLVLTDVKLGTFISKVQDDQGVLKHDLQLPVYEEVGRALYPDEEIAGSRYFSIRKAEPIEQAAPPQGFLDSFVQRSQQMLRDGHFPVRPDSKQDACGYCRFRSVCRHGERLERKLHAEAPA